MESPEPLRKSARGRIPNKRYTEDTFEILDPFGSDSEAPPPTIFPLQDSSEDEEFLTNPVIQEPDTEEDTFISGDEGSEKSGRATPVESNEDAESYTNEVNISAYGEGSTPSGLSFSRISASNSIVRRREKDRNLHSRGVVDPHSIYFSYSKESHIKFYIGFDDKDITHLVLSRDKWVRDPTLPSRKANSSGFGGMAYHFTYTPEKIKSEAVSAWDWYYERGGRSWMAERQIMRTLSKLESSKYFPTYCNPFHSFLMGPYGSQKVYKLSVGEYMKLNEAWQNSPVENQAGEKEDSSNPRKPGWILNLGTPIRCLAWAPNQSGDTQYLATATPVTLEAKNIQNSAFAPSESSSASIQIWAFAASRHIGKENLMEADRPPKLVHAICTDWGYVKALSWCPMLRDSRDEGARGKISLGLLAAIWGDGHVRVLDIQLDKTSCISSPYVKYEGAGFVSKPPDSICTCLTWISTRELVAGCANGFVAIWDISDHMEPSSDLPHTDTSLDDQITQSDSSNRVCYPFLYHMFHATYILNVTSAHPDHPHFIATSSMDGYMRLTDLKNPTMDTVLATRCRNMARSLEYHEPLQSFIAPDENDFVRAFPLRRFFTTMNFSKTECFVLSMAVGKVHPCVLMGCADGSVIATNPLRRILNSKAQTYQQTLFQHEWTPKGGGMSRFVEGFKLEAPILMRTLAQEKSHQDGAVSATIYEEATGITQLAWNPNIRCGGWAAAGTGNGLLRVEDWAV